MSSNSPVAWGPEISRHALSGSYKWGTLISSAALVVLSPVTYFGVNYAYTLGGPGLADIMKETPYLTYLPIGLAVILLLVGILRLLALSREWPKQVTLYKEGLLYRDNTGEKNYPWEDVASLLYYQIHHYRGIIPTGTTHQTMISMNNGAWIQVSNEFSQARQFAEKARVAFAENALPRYVADIKAGKAVQFNTQLTMDQQGINNGKKQLTWDSIEKLRVEDNKISILQNGKWSKWTSVDLMTTPHFYIFGALASHFVAVE